MELREIGRLRLRNQRVAGAKLESPAAVVGWLAAVQAQEISLAKWSLGMRAAGAREADIDAALASGEILRTHVLRPTWHYVRPADIGWLMRLSAPRVVAGMRGRLAQLELDEAQLLLACDAIGQALEDGRALTKAQIGEVIERAGLSVDGQRLAYILITAEMRLLVASGPPRRGKDTYQLLPRSFRDAPFDHDAALADLCRRYFTGHGPATAADLAWWSSLTLADVRRGLAGCAGELEQLTIDGVDYWWAGDVSGGADPEPFPTIHLMQAYDEYVVGYRSPRTEINLDGLALRGVLPRPAFHSGLFLDGQVAGFWRRLNAGRDRYALEVRPLRQLTTREAEALAAAVERYADFLTRPLELR